MHYSAWSMENGFQANSIVEFGRKLTKHFNVKTTIRKIDGKSVRIYTNN